MSKDEISLENYINWEVSNLNETEIVFKNCDKVVTIEYKDIPELINYECTAYHTESIPRKHYRYDPKDCNCVDKIKLRDTKFRISSICRTKEFDNISVSIILRNGIYPDGDMQIITIVFRIRQEAVEFHKNLVEYNKYLLNNLLTRPGEEDSLDFLEFDEFCDKT